MAGASGAGKTTVVERWLAFLRSQGYRVAVFKHSHHPLPADREGKDSSRLRELAVAGGLAGPAGFLWLGETPVWHEFVRWIAARAEYDLILVEGGKRAPFPKIEVVRGAERLVPDALAIIGSGGMPADDPACWTQWLVETGRLRPPNR